MLSDGQPLTAESSVHEFLISSGAVLHPVPGTGVWRRFLVLLMFPLFLAFFATLHEFQISPVLIGTKPRRIR